MVDQTELIKQLIEENEKLKKQLAKEKTPLDKVVENYSDNPIIQKAFRDGVEYVCSQARDILCQSYSVDNAYGNLEEFVKGLSNQYNY